MILTPTRAPTWVSKRRLFEQKLNDLHKYSNIKQLTQIHALIYKHDLQTDYFIAPKLVTAYSLCKQMNLALCVFSQVFEPNVHLYNTLIRGYVVNNEFTKAFAVFLEMWEMGLCPDNFTYPYVLKACLGRDSLRLVKMVHTHVEKLGLYCDVFVPNALIDCYSKCGGVLGVFNARKLFDSMGERDTVTWNSMISGLVKAGKLGEARRLFDEMPMRDLVSWNTILDGYSRAGEMDVGFDLFQKMRDRNVVSWSTMVSGYCKAGDMEMARVLFEKMPVKNLVTWTIIISGYAGKGMAKEALCLFSQMEETGLKLDDGTIISIVVACAESGLVILGKRVHQLIERTRYKCSTPVINVLVDMYAKCGVLNKAFSIFNRMVEKDLVSWNAMIQGLAMHGKGLKALDLFDRMKKEGFVPDKVTLVGVLCACTHAGLVEEGVEYFYSMESEYGIIPEIEHYGCMIDLLGRGGRLKEAFSLVKNMPIKPNTIIWSTLLGACRMHNASEYAKEALEELIKLEPAEAGNYSLLSNICAAEGDWDSVADIRLKMKKTGNQKPSGASLIELDDGVHEFTARDRTHPQSECIYDMVDGLGLHLKKAGSVQNTVC